MELNKLYTISDKENITVFNAKMKNKAIICKVDEKYYIGLNYRKMNDSMQEKEILAEELGHYYCNALYNIYSDTETVSKKEYRARKWAFKTLVPIKVLLSLKEQGYKTCYEIADKLGVSEKLVQVAYDYYKENQYIY